MRWRIAWLVRGFRFVLTGLSTATRGSIGSSRMVSASSRSTSVLATASTTPNEVAPSSCCWQVVTSPRSRRTSRWLSSWPRICRSLEMSKTVAKKTRTIPYDVAEQLRTPQEMAAYLDACLTEAPDDAAGIARALGEIARARGMSQVARDAGLSRESLYKALSENGNPSFATVLKVARALGLRLHAEAA